ncbi:MAG: c-type cytochrome [Gammaproteobacteria bacterium]|nr:c-type cytochrome [Gammaproteobacteria bacterium]MDH3858500.1 c-type cytochrome [Gammaproteobacteria bacterium]
MKFNQLLLLTAIIALTGTIPANASDINLGRDIYQRHCLSCHGVNGSPIMAAAPDLKRGQGLMQSDQTLQTRIQNGKNACPAYRGILDEQQILDVIAYIRTFF